VSTAGSVHEAVNAVYETESRRVLATLIRLLGDFDVAEEAMHDAFRAALEQWPRDGVPANPRAWLVSAGRFKAIDGLRRRARFDALDETKAADELAAPVGPEFKATFDQQNFGLPVADFRPKDGAGSSGSGSSGPDDADEEA